MDEEVRRTMRAFTAHMDMKPPGFLDRIWYRRIGVHVRLSGSTRGLRSEKWARLVPYTLRGFHRRYARSHGFFWIPCPLCDRPFGGHESGDGIPDPTSEIDIPEGAIMGMAICSRCSHRRKR